MARKQRVFVEDIPQYIKISAINEIELFKDVDDCNYFYNQALELSKNLFLDIHAYCFSSNTIEFLATPKQDNTLSKFIQNLSKRYVVYFNKKYTRTGTLWEGRYKASLVDVDNFLFLLMHHIESKKSQRNSLDKNTKNIKDDLIISHKSYLALASSAENRVNKYQLAIKQSFDKYISSWFNNSINKQEVIGSNIFIAKLEELTGLKLVTQKKGRPPKRKQMYGNKMLLDKVKHKDLKIKKLQNLNFAKNLQAIPILEIELDKISPFLPIVFGGENYDNLLILTSLGGENLAINPQGKWIIPYIPNEIRKHPFSMVNHPSNVEQQVILFDEKSEVLSYEEGEALFTPEGNASDRLNEIGSFLKTSMQNKEKTQDIIKEIIQSGILDEREIAVNDGEIKNILVKNFKVVDIEKYHALDDSILAKWVRNGTIKFIEQHLKSLDNIEKLFDLANARQQ